VLAKQFLPQFIEIDSQLQNAGLKDPIGDHIFLKAPQLIHRYESRALFTPTTICPVHCRYCFRKNELSMSEEIFHQDFTKTLEYLKSHPEISEIIFTGGDPFSLSDEKIQKFLEAFSTIPSLKDIRFHTRYPVILPGRFTTNLANILKQYQKKFRTISLCLHVNHTSEIDDEAETAIEILKETQVQLLSQTVLLKDVNDSSTELFSLMNKFISLKIRPYYLHHPDQVKGGLHFYVALSKGRQIYLELRNHLPGWALPHYVVDVPGGHGKTTAFNPESFEFSGQFLDRMGKNISIKEPDLFGPVEKSPYTF
jgi:lysine 2,3-aminomutase